MNTFKGVLDIDWCEGQQPPPPGGPDILQPGQILYPNQSIVSPATGVRLLYQTDGNLVIYNSA